MTRLASNFSAAPRGDPIKSYRCTALFALNKTRSRLLEESMFFNAFDFLKSPLPKKKTNGRLSMEKQYRFQKKKTSLNTQPWKERQFQ